MAARTDSGSLRKAQLATLGQSRPSISVLAARACGIAINAASRRFRMLSFVCAVLSAVLIGQAQTNNVDETGIYSTGFEMSEGYSLALTLAGQNGWVSFGTGGNGLVYDYFQGMGQQAFIGYSAPLDTNDLLNVWRPVVTLPTTNLYPRLEFTVDMSILDSTNGNYDDFRWSVYNAQAHRFFTLLFDNYSFQISYALDDQADFRPTGVTFTNKMLYTLKIELSLDRNCWSAYLDDTLLVANQPITTVGADLNLSDIDAIWGIYDGARPGDNYMLFDNYRIVAKTVIQPRGLSLGQFTWRLHGKPQRAYVIDASSDFRQWTPFTTNTTSAEGIFDFGAYDDSGAPKLEFYRARLAP